jgi:EF-hand domain pair
VSEWPFAQNSSAGCAIVCRNRSRTSRDPIHTVGPSGLPAVGGRGKGTTLPIDRDILERFSKIDTNGDGRIDLAELRAELGKDPKVTEEHLEAIVSLADLDDNGEMDVEEYARLVSAPLRAAGN